MIFFLLISIIAAWSRKKLDLRTAAIICAFATFPLYFLNSVGSQGNDWSILVTIKNTLTWGLLYFLINLVAVRFIFWKRFLDKEELSKLSDYKVLTPGDKARAKAEAAGRPDDWQEFLSDDNETK
ncbi:hypothetical protein [Geothrix limicola]|uniref:hypothetical protein n=1 Tax=Geothrix limicola TaxID=2927978 RepID=UPI002555AC37|nr:hypothetical protein [Geothrix limicola]